MHVFPWSNLVLLCFEAWAGRKEWPLHARGKDPASHIFRLHVLLYSELVLSHDLKKIPFGPMDHAPNLGNRI
jgi:hypothetical protein